MDFLIPIKAEKYKEGMEDDFVYHIAMFGLFTKQECLDSGFTPDFEKDKLPALRKNQYWHIIGASDYIVSFRDGEKEIWTSDKFYANCVSK